MTKAGRGIGCACHVSGVVDFRRLRKVKGTDWDREVGIHSMYRVDYIFFAHAGTASDTSSCSSPIDRSKSNFSQFGLFMIVSLISPRTASLVDPFADGSTRYFCAAS